MKTKEDLGADLQKHAKEMVRSQKRSKQTLFFVTPLFLLAILLILFPSSPLNMDNGALLASYGVFFLFFVIFINFILPIGKISEEKVEKYFKEKLSQKIKDNTEELAQVSERKSELEEELKILKEIENEK